MIEIQGQSSWAITIEGLGDSDADRLWILTSKPPGAWDVDSRAHHCLQGPLPSITQKADFRRGSFAGGEATLRILLDSGTLGASLRTRFCRPNGKQVATLQASIDDNDTSINLGVAGLDDTVVYLGREAILLGSESLGVYSGCTRGILGTTATAHTAGPGQIDDVYATWWPRQARAVTLYSIPDSATGYGDLVPVLGLVLQRVQRVGMGLELVAAHPLQALREYPLYPRPYSLDLASVGATYSNGELQAFLYLDFVPTPPAVGESARWPWGQSSAPSAGTQMLVWFKDGLRVVSYLGGADPASALWRLDVQDDGSQVWGGERLTSPDDLPRTATQAFAASPLAPALSRIGGSAPTVGSVVLALLTEDVFGAALPLSAIDTASFDRFDAELGADADVRALFVGTGDGTVKLLPTVEGKLLAPWQAALCPGEAGLRLVRLRDSDPPGSAPTAVDEQETTKNWFAEDLGEDRLVDQIRWSYGADPAGETTPIEVYDREARGLFLGADRTAQVDGGVVSDTGQAVRLAQAFAARYARLLPSARWTSPAGLPGFPLLAPGDSVTLSAEFSLLSLDGDDVIEGVDGERAVVSEVQWNLETGEQTVTALRTGYLYQTQRQIGGALLATAWNGGTKVLTVEQNHFLQSGSPVGSWTNDTDAFAVGDAVAVVAASGAVREGGLLITAKTATSVTIPATTITPVAGDYLVPDEYDNQVTAQRVRLASVADTSGEIPTAGDPGHEYEG